MTDLTTKFRTFGGNRQPIHRADDHVAVISPGTEIKPAGEPDAQNQLVWSAPLRAGSGAMPNRIGHRAASSLPGVFTSISVYPIRPFVRRKTRENPRADQRCCAGARARR